MVEEEIQPQDASKDKIQTATFNITDVLATNDPRQKETRFVRWLIDVKNDGLPQTDSEVLREELPNMVRDDANSNIAVWVLGNSETFVSVVDEELVAQIADSFFESLDDLDYTSVWQLANEFAAERYSSVVAEKWLQEGQDRYNHIIKWLTTSHEQLHARAVELAGAPEPGEELNTWTLANSKIQEFLKSQTVVLLHSGRTELASNIISEYSQAEPPLPSVTFLEGVAYDLDKRFGEPLRITFKETDYSGMEPLTDEGQAGISTLIQRSIKVNPNENTSTRIVGTAARLLQWPDEVLSHDKKLEMAQAVHTSHADAVHRDLPEKEYIRNWLDSNS